jgi:hypothetical protein
VTLLLEGIILHSDIIVTICIVKAGKFIMNTSSYGYNNLPDLFLYGKVKWFISEVGHEADFVSTDDGIVT